MDHIVFIESNTTGTGGLALERLLERGCRVTFMARRPGIYPFLAKDHANLTLVELETNDPEVLLADLARRSKIDGLLTFSEFYVQIVAAVASRLGLRYLGLDAARICRNKFRTRQALRAAGLPTPDFWLLEGEEDARRLARRITYPCVVKPPEDSSSFGVRRVENAEELLAHARNLRERRGNGRGQELSGAVLVESLLSGREFSVETMTTKEGAQVVGVSVKQLSEPPFFVELGHDFPAAIDAPTRASLENAVLAALEAVGYDFGPAHTEVRLSVEGPVVVEINPRLAGGMIPELVRWAKGIDLLSAYLDLTLGKTVRIEAEREHYAAIRFLIADQAGRFVALEGVEAARRLETVREVHCKPQPGDAVRPAEHALDRVGSVITCGADHERVIAEGERARQLIRIVIGQRA